MLRFTGSPDQQGEAGLVDLVNPAVGLRSRVSRVGTAPNLLSGALVKAQRLCVLTQRRQNLRLFAVGGGQGVKIGVPLLFERKTAIDTVERLREAPSSVQVVGEIIEHRGLLFLDRLSLERAGANHLLGTL